MQKTRELVLTIHPGSLLVELGGIHLLIRVPLQTDQFPHTAVALESSLPKVRLRMTTK